MPTSLVEIADPIRSATAHEFSRRVFWGDFNIRYGDNGRRLFHSIIEMPRDARANLVFRDGGPPLFEYDIKSCHPVLLLPLFTDPLEKAKFATVLDHDVYSTIRDVMGIPEERDGVKIQFMVCMNSTDRYVAASRGSVYCFFAKYFPVFTREVLDIRSDLAVYLQRHESEIMVRELGRICSERDLFWIPCHDGWMGIEEAEGEILKKVREAFFRETGYAVRVSRTELATGNKTSLVGEISSYDGIEPTSTDPNYRKSAEDWYAALPKHPEPVAEVMKERAEGRKHRKEALRDHRRRVNDAERLRKELAPLWNRIMNHTGQDAA